MSEGENFILNSEVTDISFMETRTASEIQKDDEVNWKRVEELERRYAELRQHIPNNPDEQNILRQEKRRIVTELKLIEAKFEDNEKEDTVRKLQEIIGRLFLELN